MKRLFWYLLALLPAIVTVSFLILIVLIFPPSLLPDNILSIAPIYITEVILGILMVVYGFRLRSLQISKNLQTIYWLLGILAGILLFLDYRLITLLQSSLLVIYALLFEQRFQSFKTYVQKSRNTFVVLNLFDGFFISICLCGKSIIEKYKTNIEQFFNESPISQDIIEPFIVISICTVLFLILPFIRGYLSVLSYRKQNQISKQLGKVFWNSNLKSYLTSLLSMSLYLTPFFQLDALQSDTILLLLILVSFNVYLWMFVYEDIDKGGEDKEAVISNWILVGLASVFLILLDQIESDLIVILTWFLPMLIPVFIGGVNNVVPRGCFKAPTPVMKKYIYYLQMMSFNTLFVFNIMSSMFTKQILKNGQIEQVNTLKVLLISVLDRVTSSNFTASIFASSIMLICSVAIAYGLSKLMIYFIRRTYMEASDKYFK